MIATTSVGCSKLTRGGSLKIESLTNDPVRLPIQPTAVLYGNESINDASVWMTDIRLADLKSGRIDSGQITHIEVLWIPSPGLTPMDKDATNASVRHIIFTDGEVGVYSGAGFVRPSTRVGKDTVSFDIANAILTLEAKTDGFRDLLTPARLSGRCKASRDPKRARAMRYAASQAVTDRLGRSLFVHNTDSNGPYALMPVIFTLR